MKYFLCCLFLFISLEAHACMFSYTQEQEVELHDIVFLSKAFEGCQAKESSAQLKFSVAKLWKGDKRNSYLLAGDCKEFSIGKKYLVFALEKEKEELPIITMPEFCNINTTRRIQPIWWRNIKAAWFLFQHGHYSYIFSELHNTYDPIKALGPPKYVPEE